MRRVSLDAQHTTRDDDARYTSHGGVRGCVEDSAATSTGAATPPPLLLLHRAERSRLSFNRKSSSAAVAVAAVAGKSQSLVIVIFQGRATFRHLRRRYHLAVASPRCDGRRQARSSFFPRRLLHPIILHPFHLGIDCRGRAALDRERTSDGSVRRVRRRRPRSRGRRGAGEGAVGHGGGVRGQLAGGDEAGR